MINFKPIFKFVESPLTGFSCNSTGGQDIEVSIISKTLVIEHGDTSSSWDKKDIQFFIDNLQKVVNNIEE